PLLVPRQPAARRRTGRAPQVARPPPGHGHRAHRPPLDQGGTAALPRPAARLGRPHAPRPTPPPPPDVAARPRPLRRAACDMITFECGTTPATAIRENWWHAAL